MNTPAIPSIIVATLALPLLPIVHLVIRRLGRSGLGMGLLAYAAVWLAIGFSAGLWSADYAIAGLGTMGFFSLGYLECFSMLCRGFSLQLIVDCFERGPQTHEEAAAEYAGRGVAWLFEKRVETLERLRMVEQRDGSLTLRSPRGFLAGRIGLLMKSLLRLGAGG